MTDGTNSSRERGKIVCSDFFPLKTLQQGKRYIINMKSNFLKETIAQTMDFIHGELSVLFHMIMVMPKF